jgi:uncharacterized protein (DUF2252 family)
MAQQRKGSAPIQGREESTNAGHRLRKNLPRSSHAGWKVARVGRDPIEILKKSNHGRLPDLVPIRFGRMLQSPFAFLRGAAALMAHDLSKTESTGLRVQLCGDCHLMNFGLFATPERTLVFDLNDFDETLPGPWEWDIKRLAASFAVGARDGRFSDRQGRDMVRECVGAYRETMNKLSRMTPLEVWYSIMKWQDVIEETADSDTKKLVEQVGERARRRVAEHLFPKIAETQGGEHRLVDQPPLLFHVTDADWEQRTQAGLQAYRETLSDELRVLLDRYRLVDAALKVVGIGSVGTRCYVALLMSHEGDPLILQFKEARRSVLEPYVERSRYENQGQRIVVGQRLMQSSSDIFLGWVRGMRGKDFFVRQLRDMKMSVPIERLTAGQLKEYATICGRALARAHAASGDAAAISGYLGGSDRIDRALSEFAVAYADQTEQDHAALVKAVRSGKLEAITEE